MRGIFSNMICRIVHLDQSGLLKDGKLMCDLVRKVLGEVDVSVRRESSSVSEGPSKSKL